MKNVAKGESDKLRWHEHWLMMCVGDVDLCQFFFISPFWALGTSRVTLWNVVLIEKKVEKRVHETWLIDLLGSVICAAILCLCRGKQIHNSQKVAHGSFGKHFPYQSQHFRRLKTFVWNIKGSGWKLVWHGLNIVLVFVTCFLNGNLKA